MQKFTITLLIFSCFLLTGCGLFTPYQPDIQQGNIITSPMVEKVKPGMSRVQVESILGEPILSNIDDNDHWAYVYTFQHDGGVIERKNLDIYFSNGHVTKIIASEGVIK